MTGDQGVLAGGPATGREAPLELLVHEGLSRRKQSRREKRASRATWVWLAPYFVASVVLAPMESSALPTKYVEWGIITLLGFIALVAGTEGSKSHRILAVTIPLILIALAYEVLGPRGPDRPHLIGALVYFLVYAVTTIYAALFFRGKDFVDHFYRFAVASALVAVIFYALSVGLGVTLMSNWRGGSGVTGQRLQGFLFEPSAWAPIVPALMITAWRRQHWLGVVLGLCVVLLAQSPTVLLVTVLGICLYYLVTTSWAGMKIPALVVMILIVVGGAAFVNNSDGYAMQKSQNSTEKFVGRLVVGIQSLAEGDQRGEARIDSTAVILQDIADSGTIVFGKGLNSASVDYGEDDDNKYRANNIWVRTLYETGIVGLVILLIAMFIAVVRMHRYRSLAAIFIPFFVASMVNSAGGHQLYKFVFLGVLIFALNWMPRSTGSVDYEREDLITR